MALGRRAVFLSIRQKLRLTYHKESVNRIQGKYMLENKKLSDRVGRYQFLCRIQIQNCTIAYDIVNRDLNEKQVFKVPYNNVKDVTSPALDTSQREMPMLGIKRWSAR